MSIFTYNILDSEGAINLLEEEEKKTNHPRLQAAYRKVKGLVVGAKRLNLSPFLMDVLYDEKISQILIYVDFLSAYGCLANLSLVCYYDCYFHSEFITAKAITVRNESISDLTDNELSRLIRFLSPRSSARSRLDNTQFLYCQGWGIAPWIIGICYLSNDEPFESSLDHVIDFLSVSFNARKEECSRFHEIDTDLLRDTSSLDEWPYLVLGYTPLPRIIGSNWVLLVGEEEQSGKTEPNVRCVWKTNDLIAPIYPDKMLDTDVIAVVSAGNVHVRLDRTNRGTYAEEPYLVMGWDTVEEFGSNNEIIRKIAREDVK